MVVTRKMTGLMASTVCNQYCSLLYQKPLTELMAAAWSSSTEGFGQRICMASALTPRASKGSRASQIVIVRNFKWSIMGKLEIDQHHHGNANNAFGPTIRRLFWPNTPLITHHRWTDLSI